MYRVYFNWIENFINAGFLKQVMTTCYGWQRFLSNRYTKQRDGKIKSLKNSIQNWPIQSHGSEVLRQAILDLTEEGLKKFFLENGPAYAHPRLISIVSEMPLSGTGKIDRALVSMTLKNIWATRENVA